MAGPPVGKSTVSISPSPTGVIAISPDPHPTLSRKRHTFTRNGKPFPLLFGASPRGVDFSIQFHNFSLSALSVRLDHAVQIGPPATLDAGREMDAFLVAVTLPTFLNTIAMFTAVSAPVPFLNRVLKNRTDVIASLPSRSGGDQRE
jgi:hypothetical protein